MCLGTVGGLLTTPGVAGQYGGDDGVAHGDGDVPAVKHAVHPRVRKNVG